MSKYGSGLTTDEVCELECEEAAEILARYGVAEDDKEIIIGMIKQAYYLLAEANKWACDVESKPEGMRASMEVYRDRVREINEKLGIGKEEENDEGRND